MTSVDACFRVLGQAIPLDHGYALYGAISRALGPELHEDNNIGVFSIPGTRIGPGQLSLDKRSRLRIRTPVEHLPSLLKLSGTSLDIDGHRLQLGVPETHRLEPAATLSARMVTIKGFCEREPFLEAVQRQLDALEVQGKPSIPIRQTGPHAGEPMRRVLRIKDKQVVGFGLVVSELTAEESVTLQEKGIGGRRHMGCGLFLPWRPRA